MRERCTGATFTHTMLLGSICTCALEPVFILVDGKQYVAIRALGFPVRIAESRHLMTIWCRVRDSHVPHPYGHATRAWVEIEVEIDIPSMPIVTSYSNGRDAGNASCGIRLDVHLPGSRAGPPYYTSVVLCDIDRPINA